MIKNRRSLNVLHWFVSSTGMRSWLSWVSSGQSDVSLSTDSRLMTPIASAIKISVRTSTLTRRHRFMLSKLCRRGMMKNQTTIMTASVVNLERSAVITLP